jgi:hypothetical protein
MHNIVEKHLKLERDKMMIGQVDNQVPNLAQNLKWV